jgi:hypothetical protein
MKLFMHGIGLCFGLTAALRKMSFNAPPAFHNTNVQFDNNL